MQPVHDYYDQLAKDYDQDRFGNSYGRYIDRMERAILRDWLRDIPPQEVVDIGCGTGRLLDFAMTGVDASQEMLKVAACKFSGRTLINASLPDLTPLQHSNATQAESQRAKSSVIAPAVARQVAVSAASAAEVDEISQAPRRFQAATCFHVFMHLSPQVITESLQTLAQLVRPGGSLILDLPSQHRRALKRQRASSTEWHANTSATQADLQTWAGAHWQITARRGILFLPVHRLPAFARNGCQPLDTLLGRSLLSDWSSYHVYHLRRLDSAKRHP